MFPFIFAGIQAGYVYAVSFHKLSSSALRSSKETVSSSLRSAIRARIPEVFHETIVFGHRQYYRLALSGLVDYVPTLL